MIRGLAIWVLVLLAAGCGRSPTSPIESSPRQVTIRGSVTDTLGQPLIGALVEALDGPRAGIRTLTGGAGKFELRAVSALDPQQTGMAEGPVTLRVSRGGFQSRTLESFWLFDISELPSRLPQSEWVIWLDAGPTIGLEPGAYTLTATIDLATARDWLPHAPCKGFPADLASHSFPATIKLHDPALELYTVSVETRPWSSGFLIHRVGRFLWFEVEETLNEDLPGFRYLNIGGTALTTEPPSDAGSSVSVPFFAAFQYCQLKSGRGIANDCQQVPPGNVVVFNSCTSESATMTFTKR